MSIQSNSSNNGRPNLTPIADIILNFAALEEQLDASISRVLDHDNHTPDFGKSEEVIFTDDDHKYDGMCSSKFKNYKKIARKLDINQLFINEIDKAFDYFKDANIIRNLLCHCASYENRPRGSHYFMKLKDKKGNINRYFFHESFSLTYNQMESVSTTVREIGIYIQESAIQLMYAYTIPLIGGAPEFPPFQPSTWHHQFPHRPYPWHIRHPNNAR